MRAFALACRRVRRFDDAASCWQRVLEMPGCPAHVVREAAEALAIHHEHRIRNLAAARTFALQSLDAGTTQGWNEGVRHRLARLDRKLSGAAPGASLGLE